MIALKTIGKKYVVSFNNNNNLHMYDTFLEALLFVEILHGEECK